ncbi:MAG: sigma-54 dependent transcriptional regulator [Desulfovermiculus sp.]
MDSSDFVRCVHQWLKGQIQNGHQLKQAPEEPFLVGISQAIRLLRKKILRISEYDFAVLVCGATGTGKEVVAHALHNNSHRSCNQFLIINCANVPASLLESELFGYRKGAFTGAWIDKPGRFELAQEGTIFLDEISEMSTYMQAKLLQVLQEKEFAPLGGVSSVKIKSRVVAATNADLKNAVAHGTFRKDLYYRLAVIRLELPRLRDRKEDVPVLVHHFLDKFSLLYQKKEVPSLSDRFWDILLAYDWPGNVRELESSIQSLVALESEELVQEKLCKMLDMNSASGNSGEGSPMRIPGLGWGPGLEQELSLQDMSLPEISQQAANKVEAELISMALQQTGGKKRQTAQILDISYKCLLNKIKNYGL